MTPVKWRGQEARRANRSPVRMNYLNENVLHEQGPELSLQSFYSEECIFVPSMSCP
jgi:hypothetical protein